MIQRADETASTRVCSSNAGVFANADPVPDQKRKQPTGAGLRHEMARQVGMAKLAVTADESKSNNRFRRDPRPTAGTGVSTEGSVETAVNQLFTVAIRPKTFLKGTCSYLSHVSICD